MPFSTVAINLENARPFKIVATYNPDQERFIVEDLIQRRTDEPDGPLVNELVEALNFAAYKAGVILTDTPYDNRAFNKFGTIYAIEDDRRITEAELLHRRKVFAPIFEQIHFSPSDLNDLRGAQSITLLFGDFRFWEDTVRSVHPVEEKVA